MTVVVTGAARGIGLAFAKAFAQKSHRVVLTDLDGELAREEAAKLTPSSLGRQLDVTDPGAFGPLIDEITTEGPIDVWVNNAGIMILGPFLQGDASLDHKQLQVNLFGVLNGTRAILPSMMARGTGTIVNVASLAAKLPPPHAAVYAASKAAIAAFGESLRMELAGTSVRVVTVFPAYTSTELVSGTMPPAFAKTNTPEEVAAALLQAMDAGDSEVYPPGSHGWAGQLAWSVLPPGGRSIVARWLRLDQMFQTVGTARSDYARRTGGR